MAKLAFHRSGLPTSRQVAEIVARGGAEALTEAQHRADAARYQEIQCRSALNRVDGMPFRWTLNPYRGCTHGCHYCFARRYHAQFELDADDEFASVILVKRNVADVLAHELARRSWRGELVAVGTATDAYQPIEGHYRLTRRSLEALTQSHTPFSVVTKGPMIVRDIDVLREASRRAGCTIHISVPSVDDDVWQTLEPGTAPPAQRLRAVRALAAEGVSVGVLIAPIVPSFSSSQRRLERTIAAAAAHGARFIGYNVMHLQPGTREHFMTFVERHFPDKHPGLERLYRGAYAPQTYRQQVKGMVAVLSRRYGLADRAINLGADSQAHRSRSDRPEQVAFQW